MAHSIELMQMGSPSHLSAEPATTLYVNESLYDDAVDGAPSREMDEVGSDSGSKSRRSATRDLENLDNSISSSRRSADNTNNDSPSTSANKSSSSSRDLPFAVLLKGLPFSVRDDEILRFLEPDVKISRSQIQRMTRRNGTFVGNCFINLKTSEEADAALAKHRKHIGSRYVEVFTSSPEERDRLLEDCKPKRFEEDRQRERERNIDKRLGPSPTSGPAHKKGNFFIHLKGLPFSVTEGEIRKFLSGCEVLQDGILLGPPSGFARKDSTCNGDAFVELASEKDVAKAMTRHKQNIGSRYVEIFKISFEQVERYMERRRPAHAAPPPTPPGASRMDLGGFGTPEVMASPIERQPLRREVMPIFMQPQPPALHTLDAQLEAELQRKQQQLLLEARAVPHHPPVVDPFIALAGPVGRPIDRRIDLIEPPMYESIRPIGQPSYDTRPRDVPPPREAAVPEFASPRPMREIEVPPVPRMSEPLPMPQHSSPSPTPDVAATFNVKLEGIPSDCKRQEVIEFLKPARPTYVEFVKDSDGRVLEASAEFDNLQDLQVSMSKYRNTIRGRSIVVREIIPEAERSPPRPKKELSPPPQVMRRRTRSPRSRSRSRSPRRRERSPGSPRRRVATRYRLMVCGIPPECDEFDIQDFFAKAARPLSIELDRDRDGRSRSAVVEFSSLDAMLDAERLDRLSIKHRQVELRRL